MSTFRPFQSRRFVDEDEALLSKLLDSRCSHCIELGLSPPNVSLVLNHWDLKLHCSLELVDHQLSETHSVEVEVEVEVIDYLVG